MKKTALGRGLDILLPEDDTVVQGGEIRMIPIGEIDRNPDQPRRSFDEDALQQLADSIREAGVLQPLLVIEKNNRFRIVAGERRYRAARLAGLDTIPCLVKDLSPSEQMEVALIENLQREDLNPMEEAQAIKSLMNSCGYTQEKAAKRLGRSRPAVANSIRLLSLPKEIQSAVSECKLSAGHARVLAGLDDERIQLALAEKTIREGLSVRALEQLAAKPYKEEENTTPPTVKALPIELQDMENRLRDALGVRTQLRGTRRKGKIILQYYSEDELETIYKVMEKLESM